MSARNLSKSKILSGLQCPKRLYLEIHQPELAQVGAQTQRAFAAGHRVGEVARTLWPGGHLVMHDQDLNAALAETQRFLAQSPATPLFEATFRHQGVLVRTDVLDGHGLTEVKASTAVKDYYLTDCAIQTWVVEGAGRPLEQVQLAHIDSSFVYPGGGNYQGLFAVEDVSDQVRGRLPEVPNWIARCHAALGDTCPSRDVGPHCYDPFDCPFIGYCTPPQPDYPVTLLPRCGRIAAELIAEGILDVRDIPEGRLANPRHDRIRALTVRGQAEVCPDLVAFLNALPLPRAYLDFETVQFAVPVWAGTRPYEQLPFQWSCHIEFPGGNVEHLEFLGTSGENPMRAFAESLLRTLGGEGPVLIYSAFEKTILGGLQRRFPDLAQGLGAIIDHLVDLLPAMRGGYYHPDQQGSWSIKAIAPLIAPDVCYEDLDEVQEGGAAQAAYLELIDPGTSQERKDDLGRQLLEYCGLDTLAMVRVVEELTGRRLTYPQSKRSATAPVGP